MSVVAQRYAEALADAAFDRNSSEKIRRDFADFSAAFAESAPLRNVLATPALPPEQKKAVIAELSAKMGLHPELKNFLFVLIDHGRSSLLSEIRAAFEAEMNQRLGIADAIVTSARELSPEDKIELTRALEKLTGKRIQAQYARDDRLIGGARVRIGSTIYDGSVREQLTRLRAQLETQ